MVNKATVEVASGDALDVRSFGVTQAMSRLFRVELRVHSRNQDVDFDAIIGLCASFTLGTVLSSRTWRGVCVEMDQVRVDPEGLATYTLAIAPRAVLLTQRKNYRVFQYKSELDIVRQILGEWGVEHRAEVDPAAHLARKFRVQYGESDFDFVCRMLEDAGISFFFEDTGESTVMVLDDEPQAREVAHPGLAFHDQPGVTGGDFVTRVAVARRMRPGKMTIGDLDYRRAPSQQPRLSAGAGLAEEGALEQFDYEPGAFLYVGQGGGSTPVADDRGATRTDEGAGAKKAQKRLLGKRQDAERVTFESNVIGLAPGSILAIADHPHPAVGSALLVTTATIQGEHDGDWRVDADAVGVGTPFRPEPITPKPRVPGLESATVVGPSSDEIHTDEYGRVRVHFHWDRESGRDEQSSCWLPVSQPWAGAGFGGVALPRVGQEVLVEFLGGDPDRPVVVGRVFTEHNKPAYPMPEGKKITGIVGKATPAMVVGAADGGMPAYQFTDVFARDSGDPIFRAQPPKPHSPYGLDNAFLLGDAQGQDITFIQSRKDLNIVVKNSWTTVVGNYRATFVGNDDILHVKNKQRIDVKENQQLRVAKNQKIEVGKLRDERIDKELGLQVLSDITIKSEGVANYKAKDSIVIESEEGVRLEVKDSSITITKTTIVVDSPKVDINPES